jgi:hypothetical protein
VAAPAEPQPRHRPAPRAPDTSEQIGASGERLTRDEAFDLLRRTVAELITGDTSVRAGVIRTKARELLGRDSESLSDRNFPRILKDAHDNDVIDLRRRGDDFEIARITDTKPVSEQVAKAAAVASAQAAASAPAVAPTPRGMGNRGVVAPRGRGGRAGAPPADLLSIGVVKPLVVTPVAPIAPVVVAPPVEVAAPPAAKKGRKPAAKKAAPPPAKKAAAKKPRAKKAARTA